MDKKIILSKKRSVRLVKSILRAVFLVGVGFVMLYPVLFMLSNSFKSVNDTLDPTVVWIPSGFNLFSFKTALELLKFGESFKNTLLIVLPCVIAYGFARFRFKFRNLLFGLLIFNIIVPTESYMIPLYVNLKTMGLLDTYAQFYVQALLGTGIRSGLYIFIFRQYFINMPKELEEASFIDGCNPLETFIKIMVPNVSAAILTVTVFSVVWYYNDYSLTGMLLNKNFPLSIALTGVSTSLGNQLQNMSGLTTGSDIKLLSDSILSAACLITALPLIGFYAVVQKYFTEGIERTGIVG